MNESQQRAMLDRAVAPHRDRLATPALVIDLDAVDHNVAAVIERVGDPQRWRPHVKTIKQATVIGRLLDAGVTRLKAATPAEVALVLQTAADRRLRDPVDVLLAYPAAPAQLAAMVELRRRYPYPAVRLGLLADSPEHAQAMADALPADADLPPFDLWLDVDIGMQRTGSRPAVWQAAELCPTDWLMPRGLHGYDGHLHWSQRAEAHAGYDALVELARALKWPVEHIVTSGTHSYAHALAHPELTAEAWSHQISPGTIVLCDRRSAEAAADLGLRQAAFVASRVIARPGDDRITLDAGSKAIAPDCPPPGCAVLAQPDLQPLRASEEHRPVQVRGGRRPDRGSLVWLVPDHVCTTVNLHAEALYLRGGAVQGSGPVEARGHRPFLRLAGLMALALVPQLGAACQPNTTELPVQLILPPDDADLEQTNNVSLVLAPDGSTNTVATNGLDFALSLELPPDDNLRTLSVFMARDDTLLAWGETPPFTLGGAADGLSLLMARPGRLTPLELDFSTPDPDALVAAVGDRGALVLSADGGTLFLDTSRYTLAVGTPLDDPPPPSDGALLGAADGGVIRIVWEQGIAAWRFDALANEWLPLALSGDLQGRPGAGVLLAADREALRLFGGGAATDVVEIPLRGSDPRAVETLAGLSLDSPRPGSSVVVIDGSPIVVGGAAADAPAVWNPGNNESAGPVGPWHSMDCGLVTNEPPAALCGAGIRDDQPSADLLRVELADGALRVDDFEDHLPVPLPDPILSVDSDAVYLQGEGRWFRVEGDELMITEPVAIAPRAGGGDRAALPNGLTLWVGGHDIDDSPVARWHFFTRQPAPEG